MSDCTCPRLSGQPNKGDCPVHPSNDATSAVVRFNPLLAAEGLRQVLAEIPREEYESCRRAFWPSRLAVPPVSVGGSAWVPQTDPGGCGAATLAMIVGCTYEEAKAEIESLLWWKHGSETPERETLDWNNGSSMTTYSLDRCLYAHGFYKQTRYAAWGHDLSVPFAPIHYAMVQQPSNNHHFVVMLGDGTVLDPLREGEYTLPDWPKATQVCGLVKP